MDNEEEVALPKQGEIPYASPAMQEVIDEVLERIDAIEEAKMVPDVTLPPMTPEKLDELLDVLNVNEEYDG